jgi:hypothetical protein
MNSSTNGSCVPAAGSKKEVKAGNQEERKAGTQRDIEAGNKEARNPGKRHEKPMHFSCLHFFLCSCSNLNPDPCFLL